MISLYSCPEDTVDIGEQGSGEVVKGTDLQMLVLTNTGFIMGFADIFIEGLGLWGSFWRVADWSAALRVQISRLSRH